MVAASTEDGKYTKIDVISWLTDLSEGLGVGWPYMQYIYVCTYLRFKVYFSW